MSDKDESILNILESKRFKILLVDFPSKKKSSDNFINISQNSFEDTFNVEFPKNMSTTSIFNSKNSHFIIADKLSCDIFLCYVPETSAKTLALKNLSSKPIQSNSKKDLHTNLFLAMSDGKSILYSSNLLPHPYPNAFTEKAKHFLYDEKLCKVIIESSNALIDSTKSEPTINHDVTQKIFCNKHTILLTPILFHGAKLALVEVSSLGKEKKLLDADKKLSIFESCLDVIAKKAYKNNDTVKFLTEMQEEILVVCQFETILTTIKNKDVSEKTIISGNENAVENDILSISMKHCSAEEKPVYLDYFCNGKTYFCRVLPLWIKTGNIGEMAFIASPENKELLDEMDKLIPTIRLMIELQILKSSHMQNIVEIEKLRSFRSEIVETVNHDMKTPLTSIMGYAELLQMGLISGQEQVAEVGLSLQNAGSQMLNLIKELEKLSKKTLIVPTLKLMKIETENFIKDTAKMMMPIFESSGLEFSTNIQSDLPNIKGDLSKLYEIVLNLLSNASKYTESGGKVTFGAERMLNNYVKIYIQDTGIGIPPEKRRMIFNKYSRINFNKPGTGLGLYLSKVYTETMGGKLFVESEGENKGSTFYLMMPSI